MSKVFNLLDGALDGEETRQGYRNRRTQVGAALGAELLGATLYELGPGKFVIYHLHHGSEELLLVLRGRPTLRTPDGERVLEEGEVVHFPAGPAGAHGLRNDTDEPVRYVVAGTRVSPEVVEYPDLGQVTGQSKHGIFFIHDLTPTD